MKTYLIILFLFNGLLVIGQPLQISIEPNTSPNYPEFSIEEAGMDIISTITLSTAFEISIQQMDGAWENNKNFKWNVTVERTNDDFPNNVDLAVKRSGNGIQEGTNKGNGKGKNKIKGGEIYLNVEQTSSYNFFNGQGAVSEIPIDVQISNLSIIHGARDYNSGITFTISER